MSIEGLHLYVSLVQVFEIDKRSRLASYYVFAYGFPALVVAISFGIRYDGYGSEERFVMFLLPGDIFILLDSNHWKIEN